MIETPTETRWLRREQIVIGDLQPRKHFSQAKIDSLAASLNEHGFDPGISRLLVRPLGEVRVNHDSESAHWFIQRRKAEGGRRNRSEEAWETVATAESETEAKEKAGAAEIFELVLGECRYRASEAAGIELLPAVSQELSDLEVLKKQLVENMQRAELNAMEEAMAFARMREMGQTPQEIAQSIGYTVQHVTHRMVLLRLLGSAAATAVEEGKITATHARALARVPSAALRDELLAKIFSPPDGSPAPWATEALEAHIKLNYVIDLRQARFDQEDPNLVPVDFEEGHEFENEHRLFGGACGDCPFRTQMGGRGVPPMCTNPECFQMKEIAAHEKWRALVAADPSEEREVVTLSHAENVELWNESGRALAYHSPYVGLKDYPAVSELRSGETHDKSWEFLIDGQAVPIVLGRDAAGKVHELVRHDLAKKAAHLNGHKIFRDSAREQRVDEERSSTAPPPAQSADERSETETLEEVGRRNAERGIVKAEIEAIVAAAEVKVRRGMVQLPSAFWGYAALALATAAHNLGELGAIIRRRDWNEIDLTEKMMSSPIAERLGFVVECLVVVGGDAEVEGNSHELWAKLFGVKLGAVRKAAERKARKENVQRPTSNARRPTEEKKKAA